MTEMTRADQIAALWAHRETIFTDEESERTDRLMSILAYMMVRYPEDALPPGFGFKGLQLTATANTEDRDRHAKMVQRVSPILNGAERPDAPLPERIAFLKLKSDGTLEDLPEGASASWAQGRQPDYIFRSRCDDSRFGLFELPAGTPSNGPRIATYLTRRIQTATVRTVSKGAVYSGFGALFLGLLMFCYSVADTIASGTTIARAQAEVQRALNDNDGGSLVSKMRDLCKKDPTDQRGGLCKNGGLATAEEDGGQSTPFASCLPQIARGTELTDEQGRPRDIDAACEPFWTTALGLAEADGWGIGLSKVFLGEGSTFSLLRYYFLCVAALTFVFFGIGLSQTGRLSGALISAQHRMSLARFQVICWSVLLFSGFAIYSAFNVGTIAAIWNVDSAKDLLPQFQIWAWAVLGITIATPSASALVKAFTPSDLEFQTMMQKQDGQRVRLAPLEQRATPKDAKFSDLFVGETMWRTDNVDLSRAQMLIVTLLLLILYTAWLMASLNGIGFAQVLNAFPAAGPILASFPDPGPVFTGLLALTHGTYIAGKWQFGAPVEDGR